MLLHLPWAHAGLGNWNVAQVYKLVGFPLEHACKWLHPSQHPRLDFEWSTTSQPQIIPYAGNMACLWIILAPFCSNSWKIDQYFEKQTTLPCWMNPQVKFRCRFLHQETFVMGACSNKFQYFYYWIYFALTGLYHPLRVQNNQIKAAHSFPIGKRIVNHYIDVCWSQISSTFII